MERSEESSRLVENVKGIIFPGHFKLVYLVRIQHTYNYFDIYFTLNLFSNDDDIAKKVIVIEFSILHWSIIVGSFCIDDDRTIY